MAESAPEDWLGAEDRKALDRLARRVVSLNLAMPAMLFLESTRPLNFVGSQFLHFFAPMVHAWGEFGDYDRLARILEDRRSIDALIGAIEREEKADRLGPKPKHE